MDRFPANKIRLAIVLSHPIQHFSPWFKELGNSDVIDLKVLYCCKWGTENYHDPGFGTTFSWDIQLLEGYSYEFLPIRSSPKKLGFWELNNPAITGVLERLEPDVVMSFGYASRSLWRAWQWAYKRNRPFLIYSDSSVLTRVAPWKKPIKKLLVTYFYRHVDGALTVGEANAVYHRIHGLPEYRIWPGVYPIDRRRLIDAVPDRVATRQRVRLKLGIPSQAFVVLLCGKLIKRKRPLDAVKAAVEMTIKELPVWFVLVGEGPLRKKIEEMSTSFGLHNVVLAGFVNQADIPSYFAASDLLLVASSMDPHPLVITEGSVFGLPILCSDFVGCIGRGETADPELNARIYPCGDVQHMSAAIASLHRDPNAYLKMSRHAVEISEQQDATVAAKALTACVTELHELGRRHRSKRTH